MGPERIEDTATGLLRGEHPSALPALYYLFETDQQQPTLAQAQVPLRVWGRDSVEQVTRFADWVARAGQPATPAGFVAVFYLMETRTAQTGIQRLLVGVDVNRAVYVQGQDQNGLERVWTHPQVDTTPTSPLVTAVSRIAQAIAR